MSVVLAPKTHTSFTKEMVQVQNNKKKMATVTCIGERKEPSKEALDHFIEIYREIIEENEEKERLERYKG